MSTNAPSPVPTGNNVVDNSNAAATALQYPTASTIPFPYPTLYPQQRDFMDTLLQALQRIANSGPLPKNEACPVLLLESPTGTGKSLSLACAAIAWLRYIEHVDTADIPSSAASALPSANWIDAYVPTSERSQQVVRQQMRQDAKQARQRLISMLHHLRQQYTGANEAGIGKAHDKAIRFQRHRSVLKAVHEARAHSEAHRRRKKKRFRSQESASKNIHYPERSDNGDLEFVLEQYHSDSENPIHVNDGWSDDDASSDSSLKTSSSYAENAARKLLSGALLDGSYKMGANRSMNRTTAKDAFVETIGDVKAGSGVRKIVYSARTHSQLSQFIQEIRRTEWGSSIRVVHLGGRKSLCCNALLKSSPFYSANERAITEACLDLQNGILPSSLSKSALMDGIKKRGKNGTVAGCPMLEGRDSAIPTLALHMQSEPTDIEEAYRMGQASQSCAYYASRTALASAEVVVLPYSMLLSKTTRDSIGLSLQQALVIVDEAHNVPEALRAIHSCDLPLPIINTSAVQLDWYIQRYSDRLAGRNLLYLGQIRKMLLAFQKHLNRSPVESSGSIKNPSGMMTATEFLISRKLENINLFRVIRFLQQSRLSQKLLGFTKMQRKLEESASSAGQDDSKAPDALSKHISAMSIVEAFLEKLACCDADGKVTVQWPKELISEDTELRNLDAQKHPSYRYVLLKPAAFFENVLDEAYALALVGGTLQPFAHVAAELLGDRNHSNILRDAVQADVMASSMPSGQVSQSFLSPILTAFTCDHVVPSSNVLLQCIGRGPTNQVLDLRYQSRCTKEVCDELGRTLVEICRTVPNGVVVFLPSYFYEAFLIRHWKKSHIWNELQAVKEIHREPKSSQSMKTCLQSYDSSAVHGNSGAVLFSVIGGKMSEGINFSDGMARCVVIMGLPYPDSTDPVLIEKMSGLDQQSVHPTITGQSYYQNLCLRAVNQSVGRAIRHAKDYAAIVLIDRRYTTDRSIWSGLPNWIKKGNSTRWHEDLPIAERIIEMKNFFKSKDSREKNAIIE
jgi:chromosome transmission fidelity protein 1